MDQQRSLATRAWDGLVESRRNWLRLPEYKAGLGSVVDFLAEAVGSEEVLLHGSNARTIEVFEPREQTSYRGRLIRAVFATPDPVWPLFFAVTHTVTVHSRWNACMLPRGKGTRARYFFSVGTRNQNYWTDGAVYLLPRTAFRPSDEPSEWVAAEPVAPVAVVPVKPEDFPFRSRVFPHVAGEPEWRGATRLVVDAMRDVTRRDRRVRSIR